MILAFNKRFVEPIMAGTKIHTFREDKNTRWKAGRSIQMATGVRTKHYCNFNNAVCISTQDIKIKVFKGNVLVSCTVEVDGHYLSVNDICRLIKNDGFDSISSFIEWFDKDFTGKIIHWTELRY